MSDAEGVVVLGPYVAPKSVENNKVVDHIKVGCEDTKGDTSFKEDLFDEGPRDWVKAFNKVCGSSCE